MPRPWSASFKPKKKKKNQADYNILANSSTVWICPNCSLPNHSSSIFQPTLSNLQFSNSFEVLSGLPENASMTSPCRIPFSLQIQSKGRHDTTYQISSETPKDSSSATVIGRPQALIIQLIKYTSRRMSA